MRWEIGGVVMLGGVCVVLKSWGGDEVMRGWLVNMDSLFFGRLR